MRIERVDITAERNDELARAVLSSCLHRRQAARKHAAKCRGANTESGGAADQLTSIELAGGKRFRQRLDSRIHGIAHVALLYGTHVSAGTHQTGKRRVITTGAHLT